VYVIPNSPKGWHKSQFCYFFPVNFKFCRQKSAAKFRCVKTSSGRVVATSFLYLTVHRWIAGDVPIYLKVAQNADFDRFCLIVLQRASEKNSIIANRKSTSAFQRVIDEPYTLPLSPPKGGSKRKFLHLALPFISWLQVIVDISDLICGLNIASPCLRMTKCP